MATRSHAHEFARHDARVRTPASSRRRQLTFRGRTRCSRRQTGNGRSVLDDARRFSILMNSASLVYNLLLAEAYEREGFDRVENPVDDYRERLDQWADHPTSRTTSQRGIATHSGVACSSGIPSVNSAVTPIHRQVARSACAMPTFRCSRRQRRREIVHSSRREREHKRAQARLTNKRLLQAWLGSSGSRPLVYRWTQMRPIIHDIHDGLERTDA